MEFLRGCLSRTFMDKTYKEHQKGALIAEAEARLGEHQEYARRQIETEKLQTTLSEAKRRLKEAKAYYQQCQDDFFAHVRFVNGHSGAPRQERGEFFMACPSHDCRGKLSTAYKCGLCEHFFCPDCHKDKGLDRNTEPGKKRNTAATIRCWRPSRLLCPNSCGNLSGAPPQPTPATPANRSSSMPMKNWTRCGNSTT